MKRYLAPLLFTGMLAAMKPRVESSVNMIPRSSRGWPDSPCADCSADGYRVEQATLKK